ncbi:MAG: prohibitin family protein [Verrucomicrobiota bacterium]
MNYDYEFRPNNVRNTVIAVIAVVVVAIVGLGVFSAMHVVEPGTRGVSVTLGKVDENFRPEGLNFKKPFVEQIINMPIKQITESGNAASSSSDLQIVDMRYKVLYRLPQDKIVELYQQYQGDPYISLIEPRVQESIKQIAAQYRAEEMIKNREKIKVEAQERLRESLDGLIDVRELVIENIQLSKELNAEIERKQIAEQQVQAKRYELEKEKIDAEIKIVRARAASEAIKIEGEALKASPEVIQLRIAEKWDGKSPQSVVVGGGAGGGGANILLPLR